MTTTHKKGNLETNDSTEKLRKTTATGLWSSWKFKLKKTDKTGCFNMKTEDG